MSIQWVGVDVSKSWFDAFVEGRSGHFDNSRAGFEAFRSWLGEGEFHVVLEPTGGYERSLRLALAEFKIRASVVNAARVHGFGRCLGKLHKTDKVDARLLAEYGQLRSPAPSRLDSGARRELCKLVATWKSLQTQLLALDSQLRSPELPSSAKRGLEAARVGLDLAMVDVMHALDALTESSPELSGDLELLTTIVGIGKVSAYQILAQLPEGDLRSARQLAAYAGTAPGTRESGSSIRRPSRVSRACNRRFRSVLYMCALVAKRFCPHLKQFAARLAARGKTKKQVVVAVMRKLTHAIYVVLEKRVAYDGAKLCPSH
jgi:transposase